MKKGYNFPYNNGGIIGGINDSGIETFKGTPIYSITKETIQNALDARSKFSKGAIKVEFKSSDIDKDKFPFREQFKTILKNCSDYWNNDNKTIDFLQNAINILSQDTISVLEIADYNTTGLKGAKESVSSPFNNLVKSSGVSNKSDDAGGSFGIGKNAPYTCSSFRTVIYSTLDEEDVLATQGVAKLVTHKQDKRDTQGTGFLGITEKDKFEDIINRPFIDEEVMENLDEFFIRKEVGTSLFVMGFEKDDTWKEDIIKATIDFYMMAILEEKLEVLVQDIVINKDTIESIIEEYFTDDTSLLTLSYYKSIVGKEENTYYREADFKGMGQIKLYLLLDENLPKKVAYIRSNGMKIIDKDRFRVTQQFAGVLYFEGKEINKFIRSLENPSHDKIEYKRHERSSYAKGILAELSAWIRDTVKSLEVNDGKNIIDAEGIGEYLPDDINEGITKVDVKERIIKKINKVEVQEVKKLKKNKDKKQSILGKAKELISGLGKNEDLSSGGNNGKSLGEGKSSKTNNGNEKEDKVSPMMIKKSRVFSPSNAGTYRVIIESANSCNSYFKLRIVGEEGSEIADIKEAKTLDGELFKIVNKTVGPIKFKKNEKKVIEVKLVSPIRCAMEVINSVNNL